MVIGLESSCTKFIARLIAANLIPDIQWDGHWEIQNAQYKVVHRSLPNGNRDSYLRPEDTLLYNYVIICTRDFNCSLRSKTYQHQPNTSLALQEHVKGIKLLRQITKYRPVTIINYETAYLLKYSYLEPILNGIGIPCSNKIKIVNSNKKYILP